MKKTTTLSVLTIAVVLFCVAFVIIAAIKRGQPAREQELLAEMGQMFTQADALYAQGLVDAAYNMVSKAGESRFQKAPESLFSQTLQFYLMHGYTEDACRLVVDTAERHPEISVQGACNQVYNTLRHNPRQSIAWCRTLLTAGIPRDTMRGTVCSWMLNAAMALQDETTMNEAVSQLFVRLKPEEGAEVAATTMETLFNAARTNQVDQLVALIERRTPLPPAYRPVVLTAQVRLSLARGDWTALPKQMRQAIVALDDKPLCDLLRLVSDTLRKGKRLQLLDGCYEEVLFKTATKKESVKLAASLWIENIAALDKFQMPERFQAMIAAQVDPALVVSLYCRFFYSLITSPSMTQQEYKAVVQMSDLGMRLLETLKPDNSYADSLKLILLDCSFLTENFDRAFKLLETGVPGRDAAWVKSLVDKLKAHQALKQGRPLDAIAHFRAFMEHVRTSPEGETCDPSSGTLYTREMVLGRNAKRIADIYDMIPDAKAAKEARAEAKAYFMQAKRTVKDEAALRVIASELATLQ